MSVFKEYREIYDELKELRNQKYALYEDLVTKIVFQNELVLLEEKYREVCTKIMELRLKQAQIRRAIYSRGRAESDARNKDDMRDEERSA